MENISSENLYVIDLTYAKTPADVVFELSTIIDAEAAHNQKVFLKLGNIDLNQSQLLSINSLINSINSTLSVVSSESKQTELAAATLGFLISNAAQEKDKEDEKPVSQYVPMTEHLETPEQKLEEAIDEATDEAEEEFEVSEEKIEEDFEEKMMLAAQKAKEKIFGESAKPFETQLDVTKEEKEPETPQEVATTEAAPEISDDEIHDFAPVAENTENSVSDLETAPKSESEEKSIQDELDSIFDSENKLENIFAQEAKNFPEAKEGFEIEIPQEELT